MIYEKMPIKQLEMVFAAGNITPEQIEILRSADSRVAVQRLIRKWERSVEEFNRVRQMYSYERNFYEQNLWKVAGVDEAGRGPLAGPLVVAAVILPPEFYLPKINDSKKLSPKVRESLYPQIIDQAIAVERVVVAPAVIDELNIYQATRQAMRQAVSKLKPQPEAALIDAMELNLSIPHQSLIKGDALSASIAAASVVAKVERDHMMDKLAEEYPEYGFVRHKGYGTAEHLAAIQQYGPCPEHRRSFEPIKSWRE